MRTKLFVRTLLQLDTLVSSALKPEESAAFAELGRKQLSAAAAEHEDAARAAAIESERQRGFSQGMAHAARPKKGGRPRLVQQDGG